jgi:hypothetical protein
MGGLNGTVVGEQTAGARLPSPLLSRNADGKGNMVGLEIYTAIGSTNTQYTLKYTNQAGTANQISQSGSIGGTNNMEAGRIIIVPWAAGDTGVRIVTSVSLNASTVTAGNFGVTIFKPLLMVPMVTLGGLSTAYNSLLGMGGFLPAIPNDACLFWLWMGPAAASGVTMGSIYMSED